MSHKDKDKISTKVVIDDVKNEPNVNKNTKIYYKQSILHKYLLKFIRIILSMALTLGWL